MYGEHKIECKEGKVTCHRNRSGHSVSVEGNV